MTRHRPAGRPEIVRLSVGDWAALVLLLVTLVGTAWKFTLDITGHIQAIGSRVTALEHRIDRLER